MKKKTLIKESPDRLIMQYQNDAKGAAMGLLTAGEDMAGAGSTQSASEYASYVMKQANIIVDAMVALEKHNSEAGSQQLVQHPDDMQRVSIKETHDENVFAMADAVANALGHEAALENMYKGMGKDEGIENMEHIARHYEVEIPDMRTDSGMEGYWDAFDQLKTAMGDEAFFDNTIQAMETQTATELFDFIMRNYEISMGDDEVEDFDPNKHWESKVRQLRKEEEEDDVNQEVILKSKMQCAYAGMEFQGQISDEESAAFFREMADIAEQRGDFGAIVDDLRAQISGEPKPAPTKMTNHWAESKNLGDRIAESLSKKLKEYGWDDDDDEFGGEDLSQYEKEFPDAFNAGGDRDDDAEAAAAKDAEIDDLMSKYGMSDGDPEEEEVDEAVKSDGRTPEQVELANKVAEIMETDPDYQFTLKRFVEKFLRYSQSGGSVEGSLEAACPDWVPGQDIFSVVKKAKAELGDVTTMKESGGVSAEQFADEHGLDLQTDNDGQKIIYVDADQAFSLSMRETDAIIKAAGWDVQRTDDGFVIYTGEHAGGGAIDRGYMEEPEDGFGSPAHYQEDTGAGHSQLRHSRLNETLMKWAIK